MTAKMLFLKSLIFLVTTFSLLYAMETPRSQAAHCLSLTEDQIETFKRDGVVVVKGILSKKQISDAQQHCDKLARESRFGPKFLYKAVSFHDWGNKKVFRDISLFSAVPKMAGLFIDAMSTSGRESMKAQKPVRLLKDAILSFEAGRDGCGRHVDDIGFWPCYEEVSGVNVWITLSPITKSEGGGLAVAPGSHKASWAKRARQIIRNPTANGLPETCNLAKLAPKLNERIEKTKVTYDLEPGDALILDRWTFHKADQVKSVSTLNSKKPAKALNRYSVRYAPENARLIDTTANSHFGEKVFKEENFKGKGGSPLSFFGSRYPQVYPNTLKSEIDEINANNAVKK